MTYMYDGDGNIVVQMLGLYIFERDAVPHLFLGVVLHVSVEQIMVSNMEFL